MGSTVTPAGWPAPDPSTRRYLTPTGTCCIRSMRVDGTVAGSGDCVACGTCLLLIEQAWGGGAGGEPAGEPA